MRTHYYQNLLQNNNLYICVTYTTYMTYKLPEIKNLPDDSERSSIGCTKRTKRELKSFGVCGESEEDVIKRLMFKKRTGKDTDDSEFNKKVGKVL